MHAAKRKLLGAAAGAAGLAALVVGYAEWPTHTRAIEIAPDYSRAAVERGRYVAIASDCTACHSAAGQPAFTGGVRFATPIGTLFSTNITPDPKTGIGAYSLGDFDRAIRHGIRKNGDSLFPAMPYPSYAHLTDRDVTDLYAFFMKDVTPVYHPNASNPIPFPLSARWPLALWRKAFGPDPDRAAFDPRRFADPHVARGAYLVEAAGHCGACHTPRSVTLAEEGLDDHSPSYLAGGQVIDGWYTVNLRGDRAEGLGRWSKTDIISTLLTARNPRFSVSGTPMNDAVSHSLQHLTPDDLDAIAGYLKTLPSGPTESARYRPIAESALAKTGRGAEIYQDSCSACHLSSGRGSSGAIPSLAGNGTVLAPNPISTIHIILAGSSLPATGKRPSRLGMPAFGWRYSDQDVADLATFLRSTWGNHAAPVSPAEVRKERVAVAHPK